MLQVLSRLRRAAGQARYLAGAPLRMAQRWSLRPISWLHGGTVPAISRLHQLHKLTPSRVLAGYVQGMFPTGESSGSIVWHNPSQRAVIPTNQVRVSRRLKGYLNKDCLRVSFNRSFDKVMEACADRQETWITEDISKTYLSLHESGFAHSVEAWLDERLVGGGYGLALGTVFFLESMFCREDHASKVAFIHLARQLEVDGFQVIDCQFLTEHWRRLGAKPVPRDEFIQIVTSGLNSPSQFTANDNNR